MTKRDLTKDERIAYARSLKDNPLLWEILDEIEESWFNQLKYTLLPFERKHYLAGLQSVDRLRQKIPAILHKQKI